MFAYAYREGRLQCEIFLLKQRYASLSKQKIYKMKSKLFSLVFAAVFIWSCSSDSGNSSSSKNDIVGTWDATALNVDVNTASEEAQLGQQVLNFLSNNNCFIITLEFNEDLTAEARNAVANLDVSIGAGGLVIPCPTEFEIETNTYTYANGVVSFVNEDGETVNAIVSINGDTMTVNAASLEIPDFDETGELVFTRR
ncbi:MAG: hypothetical protein ACJART_002459 [Maribacter sp.]